jgi:nitrous oxidase accessory protein
MTTIPWYLLATLCWMQLLGPEAAARTWRVGPAGDYTTIKAALTRAADRDTIFVSGGIYREGNIIIGKAVCLLGEGWPVLDGQFKYEVLSVKSSAVIVKGFCIRNSGRSALNDPGAIKIYDVRNVVIEGNLLVNNYFGVYLQYARNCIIKDNIIRAAQKLEHQSGNGIHCWKSDSLQILGNKVEGHRDGIYFEFVTASVIWRNISRKNLRYGLHFMFSHNNAYITNFFKSNGAGVAVMFTKKVVMINNVFEDNRGDAAYGILFKELSDCYLSGNRFIKNTTGIFFDGSNRVQMERNTFESNGWGMRMQANCVDNQIAHNNFLSQPY